MSGPIASELSGGWATQSFAVLSSANSIVTSTATSVTPVTFTAGSGFASTTAGVQGLVSRLISVTTAAHAGSYKTGAANAIVVTGTDYNNNVVTDTLVLTAANGGETITGVVPMMTVTKIAIYGQNDALGAWTFGVGDIFCAVRELIIGTGGTLKMQYDTRLGSYIDTLPAAVVIGGGQRIALQPTRIYSTSTATNITLVF
jgi:hypothetical protein